MARQVAETAEWQTNLEDREQETGHREPGTVAGGDPPLAGRQGIGPLIPTPCMLSTVYYVLSTAY
jgi:hypothetical protein